MTLEQARLTLDNTPVETSVETEVNKQARSDGVQVFKLAFEETKNILVRLKARMTAISSIIEVHASEVTHAGEAQNVTVRQR